jgi:selenoprotein W-related protein
LGDELRQELGASVELLASSGGVFEVVVDGKLLFSKKNLNRFPEEGEVFHLIRAASR